MFFSLFDQVRKSATEVTPSQHQHVIHPSPRLPDMWVGFKRSLGGPTMQVQDFMKFGELYGIMNSS